MIKELTSGKKAFSGVKGLITVENQDWYKNLVEDCKDIIVESSFASRWALIEGYHQLGERIIEDLPKLTQKYKTVDNSLQQVAVSLGKSTRSIYYAYAFATKFPDLNKLPEGKNTLWRDMVHKYLPEPKENKIEIPLPKGKYHCLVVDPPWEISWIPREVRPKQVELDYPTMTIEAIRKLPISDLAYKDAHLYLWTTHKHLPNCFDIVKGWGFDYRCLMTWIKNVGFTPFSWMYSTEHVLFCTKGSLPLLKKGLRLDFSAKVREHSRKPDEFYELVKQASPEPRIDMFSREKRDGFDQWGNEKDKFNSPEG